MKILIADDDEIQRDVLTAMLEQRHHEVTTVSNGAQAWETLQRDPISMVFTDWMMPELNGLELIRKVRASQLGRYVYMILCTGKNARADLIEGMRCGADDFLTKPIQEDELLVRMASGERVLDLEKRLEQKNRKLASAYDTIRHDLEAAARMQRSLLPPATEIRGVRFESLFLPASMVAGDIFNFFPLNETTTGFYQLDVSGHGIPAAMLSVTLSKMLSSGPLGNALLKRPIATAPWHEVVAPHEALGELNRRFQDNGDMYFTMVYGVLGGPESRRLRLAQAGHPHPIYLARGQHCVALGHGGFPLGVLPHMDYELCEREVGPGDRMFLTSDGVLECVNSKGEQFGDGRLKEFVERHRDCGLRELLDALQEMLKQWVESDDFEDDVSVVAMEFQGSASGECPDQRELKGLKQ